MKDEFNSFTKAQRDAVVALHKQNKKNGGPNKPTDKKKGPSFNRQIKSLQADMISMGDAIIAGVKRANGNDEDMSALTTPPNTADSPEDSSTKRKAQSGSVGEFFRQQHRNRQN